MTTINNILEGDILPLSNFRNNKDYNINFSYENIQSYKDNHKEYTGIVKNNDFYVLIIEFNKKNKE